jgi:hypothetical protein
MSEVSHSLLDAKELFVRSFLDSSLSLSFFRSFIAGDSAQGEVAGFLRILVEFPTVFHEENTMLRNYMYGKQKCPGALNVGGRLYRRVS